MDPEVRLQRVRSIGNFFAPLKQQIARLGIEAMNCRGAGLERPQAAGPPHPSLDFVEAARSLKHKQFVLDGEIVVPVDGVLSFDHLLQRIHPAESRIKKLAAATPSRRRH